MSLISFIRKIIPANQKAKKDIDALSNYLKKEDLKKISKLIKTKDISISYSIIGAGKDFPDEEFPLIENEEYKTINEEILKKIHIQLFKKFSKSAKQIIPLYIAPNIFGYESIKKAVSLQLFSDEAIHILLLGDPGTGKTDILSSAAELSKISSFGLGSGTSGIGLSVTIKGKNIEKGLLPLADKGLCAIDELNLMKDNDYASLYNAMEKGFVSYDKGGNHLKFDARIKLLATANPKNDKFKSQKLNDIKKQIPFDSALLSRFNLIFIIHKPNIEEFRKIGKKIIDNQEIKKNEQTLYFIKNYIYEAQKIKVKIPKSLEDEVLNIAEELRKNEEKIIFDITPRLINGILRLVKSSARMELREQVNKEDISYVKNILFESLNLN
jgi:replicative DNA helicase Mcm